MPKGSDWNHLPTHLLVLIFQKLWEDKKREYSTTVLQLVCKSWRAAFQEQSRQIDDVSLRMSCSNAYFDDLFYTSKFFPDPVSLSVDESFNKGLWLHPLSTCSRLLSLTLVNNSDYSKSPKIDLLLLPAGLRSLELTCFEVEPACFEHIRCVQLTKLTFLWDDPLKFDTADLLENFLSLEVSLFSSTDDCPAK